MAILAEISFFYFFFGLKKTLETAHLDCKVDNVNFVFFSMIGMSAVEDGNLSGRLDCRVGWKEEENLDHCLRRFSHWLNLSLGFGCAGQNN